EIFKNDAFDRLRAQLKDTDEPFEAMVDRRVVAVGREVTSDGLGLNEADLATFLSCDTVIHSAAAVASDSTLDSAVEINLLGPTRIDDTLNGAGVTPHLVAVSTCYVAGNRRGNAPEELVSEGPWDLGLSWRKEVAAARRLRSDTEAISRQPEKLPHFRRER